MLASRSCDRISSSRSTRIGPRSSRRSTSPSASCAVWKGTGAVPLRRGARGTRPAALLSALRGRLERRPGVAQRTDIPAPQQPRSVPDVDQDDRFGRRADPAALVLRHHATSSAERVDFFLRLFLQETSPPRTRQRLLDCAASAERLSILVLDAGGSLPTSAFERCVTWCCACRSFSWREGRDKDEG